MLQITKPFCLQDHSKLFIPFMSGIHTSALVLGIRPRNQAENITPHFVSNCPECRASSLRRHSESLCTRTCNIDRKFPSGLQYTVRKRAIKLFGHIQAYCKKPQIRPCTSNNAQALNISPVNRWLHAH